MQYLLMLAGGIFGWILVEFVVSFTSARIPFAINLGMMFIFGLLGYSFWQ